MSQNQGVIEVTAIEQTANAATAFREKAVIQLKARDFATALETAKQIEDESQRIQTLKEIASAAHPGGSQIIALRALLLLPIPERNAILAQQVEALAGECFLPGSEEMEWVEEYIEDDNWDDE